MSDARYPTPVGDSLEGETLDPRLQPTGPLEEPTLADPSGPHTPGSASGSRSTESRSLASRSPLTLRPGDRFASRYEILSTLGRGGFSHVLKARDSTSGEMVALKFLAAEDTHGLVDRMQRELRLARDLRHPNIVHVYELLEAEGFYCLAMEFVAGGTLKQSLAETRPLTTGRALEILLGITSALAAVHAGGIVHRDLKPQNLIVTPEGGVKLLDFGLARTPDSTGLTATGTILGTPEYMSPEQVEGKQATARSDLYSLGVIAWELLVGDTPFHGDSPLATALQHVRSRVPDPRKARPDCPEDLARLIVRLTEPQPARRPGSAQEVLVELTGLARGARRSTRSRRRAPLLIAAAAALVAALGGGVWLRSHAAPPGDPLADGVLQAAFMPSIRAEILGAAPFLSALQDATAARLSDPRIHLHPLTPDVVAKGLSDPRSLAKAGIEEVVRLSLTKTDTGAFRVAAELVSTRDGSTQPLSEGRDLKGLDFEAIDLAARDLGAAYLASVESRAPSKKAPAPAQPSATTGPRDR